MALFTVENLSFTYPNQKSKALDDICLTVEEGEFLVICGQSGCGKSTLLRHLKREIAPFGRKTGTISYRGRSLPEIDPREAACEIGFVMQNPDNQLVTDKVWHELAFGLENLGFPSGVIRRRVAEMASFFGIQGWFHKDVTELSGGQKQMLNLASVMVMQPRALILDEPTSQLDPIASSEFLETVRRINRDLSLTVILTEHRLEEVFPAADRVVVMENGKILCAGPPREIAQKLSLQGAPHNMLAGFPAPVRIFAATQPTGDCPLTVREGRRWLSEHYGSVAGRGSGSENKPSSIQKEPRREPALELRDLWFRYEKNGPDILKGLTATVNRGEVFCILGGNGAGKSTALSAMAGLLRAYRGKIDLFGKNLFSRKPEERYQGGVAMLPQNPQSFFVRDTLGEDLSEFAEECRKTGGSVSLDDAVREMGLSGLLDRHPFDLSGGEQQKAAFAKILLRSPRVILLDEPTKGLDAHFKAFFGRCLQRLAGQGTAVVVATHDVEFAAEYATRCALFFDGSIVSQEEPAAFFAGNSFYTTAANRMARHLFFDAVTCRDVIGRCLSAGGKDSGPS